MFTVDDWVLIILTSFGIAAVCFVFVKFRATLSKQKYSKIQEHDE
jgi:hypothetical protein